MYNPNDILLAQDRYQEWVKAAELMAKLNRDETGMSPMHPSFTEQIASWKELLQHGSRFAWQRR